MRNRLTATIEFDFKGLRHRPSIELDLDQIMETKGELPETLYRTIAQANGIDLYSYEYEMLESEEIQYRNPEGFVTDYLRDNRLDKTAFEREWHRRHTEQQLRQIAADHLDIDAEEVEEGLLKALWEAYQLGKG